MRISDWSSDVCSSDLRPRDAADFVGGSAGRILALSLPKDDQRHPGPDPGSPFLKDIVHFRGRHEAEAGGEIVAAWKSVSGRRLASARSAHHIDGLHILIGRDRLGTEFATPEIGRASCRESGGQYV